MAVGDLYKNFGLSIMVWNCYSIFSNLIEFKKFIFDSKPDVICLCETWLKLKDILRIQGYKVFRNDRFGKGGGVAIMVSDILLSRNKEKFSYYDGGVLEALVIQIHVKSLWIDLCVMYNPCKVVSQNEFMYYFDHLSVNSIVCGDQNAHHPMWATALNTRSNMNSTGSNLFDALTQNTTFTLLTPPGTPTYFNKNRNIKSTIDLVFGSGIFSSCDKVHVGNLLGSDHYPVSYCFDYSPTHVDKFTPNKWNFSRLNWKDWKSKLTSNFSNSEADKDIIQITKLIEETTKELTSLSSKKIRPKQYKPFWSPECSYYIALRRKAQKKYEKFPSAENKKALNRQSAIVKRFLLGKKREKWQEFCNGLNYLVPISRVWRFFRSMNGSPNFDFEYPVKAQANLSLINDIEIANHFAEHYSDTFNRYPTIVDSKRKSTEIRIAIQLNFDSDFNSDFHLHELKNAIGSLNINSAMGADFIHNQFFYNFPTVLLGKLLHAINQSWRTGDIPSQLKLSTLLPILKSGKDATVVDSYRPISLLSCFSKLIEKLVSSRLYSFAENRRNIPIYQSGFRKNHSCIDKLIYY